MIFEKIDINKAKLFSIISLLLILVGIDKAPNEINIKLIHIIGLIAIMGLIYYFDTLSVYTTKAKIYYFLISFTILGITFGVIQYFNIINLFGISYTLTKEVLKLIYALFASGILAYYIINFDRFNIVSFILGIILIYSYTYIGFGLTIILNIIEEKLIN